MVKKVIAVTLCAVLWMHADWLDDLSVSAVTTGLLSRKHDLNHEKAKSIIEKTIKDDKKEKARLEKLIAESKGGIAQKAHEVGYQASLKATQEQLSYHEKVLRVINELPQNKHDREKFVALLVEIRDAQKELDRLKSKHASTVKIAAQDVFLNSKKALIKGKFLL